LQECLTKEIRFHLEDAIETEHKYSSDNSNGGGHVVYTLISPAFSTLGYSSTTLYQHESVLRLMLEGLGITTLPGAAANASTMWTFFSN